MKMFLNGVLVVEGKEDAAYLSNFVDSEIVTVNGFELSEQTISYLKDKAVITLFDPDEAGNSIRERFNKLIPNCSNILININRCTRGIKNGVAECEKDELIEKLSPFSINKPSSSPNITSNDLNRLGLIGKDKDLRLFVCEKLNLGYCNGKQLLKRLSFNKISLETLEKIVREFKR